MRYGGRQGSRLSARPFHPWTEETPLYRSLFEALLEGAPVGAALIDTAGRYLWVNARLAALGGKPPEAHVGYTLREVLPPAVAAAGEELLARVAAGDEVNGVEVAVELPDGGVRTFVHSWYPLTEEGREVIAALVWEITEERAAAASLSASHERLDLVLASGGMGTWDWDLRAEEIRWDERTAAIFGIPLEEFRGTFEHFNTFLHPDDAGGMAAAVAQAIETRGELRREYRIVRPDGETRWVSVRGRVLAGADGGPDSLLGVIQDRTETHSEGERLARTLETMADAFIRLDADLRFTYVNARAETMLQASRGELIGTHIWDSFPEGVGTAFQEHYEHVHREQVPTNFEAHFAPFDLWVEVQAHPDDGGLAIYFRDIGERRRRQAEQEAAAAAEQRAHVAGARLLDVAARIHVGDSSEDTAATACQLGLEVFDCTRVSLWRVDGEQATLVAQSGGDPLPDGTVLRLADLHDAREVIASGRPRYFADLTDTASAVERDLARQVGARSYVYAPVELGGSAGMLMACLNWAEEVEPFDGAMLDIAARFAQQTALAMEQANRRRAQTDATRLNAQLQASLLPSPVELPSLFEVGSLYRPGERRLLLGGDFTDVLVQPDGGMALVIGDVTGHGPEAAAIGAAMRAGWRALALSGVSPSPKLALLDDLLRTERTTDEQLVSVCCVRIEPDGRTVTIASAGHPPPILSTPEGISLADLPVGLLLGLPVSDGNREEVTVKLSAPWSVLLYTDGLPEARQAPGSSERIGLEVFAEHVRRLDPLRAEDLDEMLRDLEREVRAHAGQPIDDDVALLILRVTPD